jgi:hypothetical protein
VKRRISSSLSISILLCNAVSICAQERCRTEAKLLLKPSQAQSAVAALDGSKESHGQIYFFDTEQLDLFSQGVIIRIRTGAKKDFTVKLRLKERDNRFAFRGDGVKCETDLSGVEELASYSLSQNWDDNAVPQTGEEIGSSLSSAQRELLVAAKISVDWRRVKRHTEIHATDWQAQLTGSSKTLTIELWEWPGGKILELSTRTGKGRGVAAIRQLRELAQKNGLMIEEDQTAKTSLVLHSPA